MFRITEDPSSGRPVQCLDKNYKNDSIVSVDMDKVRICCHNTDLVHVNGHDRIILVIFSQALYKAPWWWILRDPKHVGALLNPL
jgi:hypothetical protein